MAVIVAKTAGFCYGVKRAMDLALKSAHTHRLKPVYTLGPLVHNRQAVDLLRARNIIPVENCSEIQSGPVLIRAHGISPQLRKELQQVADEIIDATCPHVAKAQELAQKYAAQDYTIIIVGDRGHPETTGILGYIGEGKAIVLESLEEIDQLPRDLRKVCVIAQTTQSGERFLPIAEKIKSLYPDALVFNTVCGATAQRQKEIKELAEKVDLMIVVGGRHSANTRRLVEISKQSGVPTIHIETAEELKFEEIINHRNIGVTAGASTPHWVLRNVIEQLHIFEEQRRALIIRLLLRVIRFLIYSQLYLAAGAGCVAYAVQVLLQIPVNPVLIVLAAAYVLSMHILNRYLSLPPEKELLYGMQKYFSSHRRLMWLMGIAAGILSLLVSFYLELTAIILVALSLILGAVYSLAIIPPGCLPHLRYRRLMDIPGSKDLFTAIAWVMVTVIIPFLANKGKVSFPALCLSALTIMFLVMVRSFIYDIREIEEDIIVGRETMPIILGLRRIQKIIFVLVGLMGISLVTGWLLNLFPPLSLLMLLTIGYIIFAYGCKWSAEFYHSLAYDALIDGQFILVGILAYIWKHFLQ